MQSSSRALVVGGLVAAFAATAPSAFAAQPRLLPAQQFRLAGNEADSRSCAVRTVTGSSALKRALTAPADGYLTVRTSGSPAGNATDAGGALASPTENMSDPPTGCPSAEITRQLST